MEMMELRVSETPVFTVILCFIAVGTSFGCTCPWGAETCRLLVLSVLEAGWLPSFLAELPILALAFFFFL
jgi:hypothetical protein